MQLKIKKKEEELLIYEKQNMFHLSVMLKVQYLLCKILQEQKIEAHICTFASLKNTKTNSKNLQQKREYAHQTKLQIVFQKMTDMKLKVNMITIC
jgi:hypothetical protein